MSVDISAYSNLDAIFAEIGEFKTRQVIQFALICIPNILSAAFIMSYAFTSNTLDYRCKVSECDLDPENRQIDYNQSWLPLAIPFNNGTFENCYRFAPANSTNNKGFSTANEQCTAQLFDKNKQIKCSEFVYKTDEKNVQTEFNIHCSDSYKLALIGTANNVGRFIFFPLTGIISDKFGRLVVAVIGTLCASIFGLIKSFSVNYTMFIILEFLESSAGTCTYAAIFLLSVEWVSSKYRVVGSSLIAASFPLGEILLGVLAMCFHDFRFMLRVLYAPGLLVIFYFWLVPESVRWLLVSGRVDRAIELLEKSAAANGKELPQQSIDMLRLRYAPNIRRKSIIDNRQIEKLSMVQELGSIIKSKRLLIRFICGCYCWTACCYCYYGLSLTATHIPGENRYISFIMVAAVEIPGTLITIPLLSRFARRKLMFFSLFLTGLATIVTPWVQDDKPILVLMLFMVGKASITCAFTILYIFTAEVWPTNLRTTMMNLNSMFGRIGGMIAPMTPILAEHNAMLPFLLFGGTAILAGLLILAFPETLNKKLPDTTEEAKHL